MAKSKSRLRTGVKRVVEANRSQVAPASNVKTTKKAPRKMLELIRTKPGLTKICRSQGPARLLCCCSADVLETSVYRRYQCVFWTIVGQMFHGFKTVRPYQK